MLMPLTRSPWRPSATAGLSRRPLTASAADGALFVDRVTEATTIRRAVDLALNTFVTGPPGSGKTSLLRHLERRLDDHPAPVVYVNIEAASSVPQALVSIARAIEPGAHGGSRWSAVAEDETDLIVVEVAIAARVGDDPLVLLVDGVSEAVAVVLFGRYRDRLWEMCPQVCWVAASRHRSPPAPAGAFFDRVVELGPFPQSTGAEVIERRLPDIPVETRTRLATAVGTGQPLSWVLAAQRLALAADEPETVIDALAAHRTARAELPERLRILYDTVGELGPVHAGDRELLARVRASRPWVVTGLKQIEAAGLVRSERQGRRMLYEVTRTSLADSRSDPTATAGTELSGDSIP